MDVYLSSIMAFAFSGTPQGFAPCNGQLLSLTTNQALFSLLGTTFGGDGRTTFGLPDLRGRVPIGSGQGPNLQNYNLGQLGGVDNLTLTASNLPLHSHSFTGTASVGVTNALGNSTSPQGAYFANAPRSNNAYCATGPNPMAVNNGITSVAGTNTPVQLKNPYMALNYCIATSGSFPSRN
jgi:microcystin-dependent protein